MKNYNFMCCFLDTCSHMQLFFSAQYASSLVCFKSFSENQTLFSTENWAEKNPNKMNSVTVNFNGLTDWN